MSKPAKVSEKAMEAAARRLTQQWPDRFADHRLPCNKRGCLDCVAISDLAAAFEEYAREVAWEAYVEGIETRDRSTNGDDELFAQWWEGRK